MRRSLFAVVFISSGATLFLVVAVGIGIISGHDWMALLRDRGGAEEALSPYAGLISDIGIFMLALSTSIYTTAVVLGCRWSALAILTAALPALISLDDYAMLHEGDYEIFFYAGYALAGISLICLQLSKAAAQSWLLMSALFFLGIAMFADFIHLEPGGQTIFGVTLWGARQMAEDALKFVGYTLFSAHLLYVAKEILRGKLQQKPS